MVHEPNPELERYQYAMGRGLADIELIAFNDALSVDVVLLHSILDSVQTRELAAVAAGFNANIKRAMHQLALPAFIAYFSKRSMYADCMAHFNITGNPDGGRHEELDEETKQKCLEEYLRIHYAWIES